MGNLKFECPECDGTSLEEITVNVTVASTLADIQRDGFVEYIEQTNDGGIVERYQCEGCGYIIKNEEGWEITAPEEMYSFAIKKGWINNA